MCPDFEVVFSPKVVLSPTLEPKIAVLLPVHNAADEQRVGIVFGQIAKSCGQSRAVYSEHPIGPREKTRTLIS